MPLPRLPDLIQHSTELETRIGSMRTALTKMEADCLIADVPSSLRLTTWDLTQAVSLTLSILEKQATTLRRAIAEAETGETPKP